MNSQTTMKNPAVRANVTAKPPAATPNHNLTMALQSPRAVDAEPQQLEYVLAKAMAKAFADMGLKADERHDEITYLVQNMPGEVIRNLPCIRVNEIPEAINRGIMQHYGPFYGLNVATFMRFLIEHYKSEQRALIIKNNLAAAKAATVEPSHVQLRQNRVNRILAAFAQYQKQGFYNDYGSLVFDSMNALRKIPVTHEREAAILEQARQNLLSAYSRGSIYPQEREKLKNNLNRLLRGNGTSLILTEAKRITLIEVFDYLINHKIDMEKHLLT